MWLAIGVLLTGYGLQAVSADGASSPSASVERFLQQHWQTPIPPQGDVPDNFSQLEASLEPESCGQCHQKQYKEWQSSFHSKAMGAGLMGQLITMPEHDRAQHQSCLRCHAPLAEQADALVEEIRDPSSSGGLHRKGLVCAACHVRNHQRFGPARKNGSLPAAETQLPHNGWSVQPAFGDSRFCASCHQFEPNGFALNGKLLENTYVEWQESRYAKAGVSCQQCHMPDRQHLWRGIHDKAMVQSGVTIDVRDVSLTRTSLNATLVITNSGTGHRFPTYVTPQVVMQAYQADNNGEMIPNTDRYFVVARRVALNLSHEVFDTRLAPGQSAQLDYVLARSPEANTLVMRVYVEPDAFYAHFFTSRLASDTGVNQKATRLLREAQKTAANSAYTLYEQWLALPD